MTQKRDGFGRVLETYATAMVLAQLLENSLAAALLLHRWTMGSAATPVAMRKASKLTLGQLTNELLHAGMIDDSIAGRLRDLVAERNMLAHHFFRLNAGYLGSPSGHSALMRRLRRSVLSLGVAMQIMNAALLAASRTLGWKIGRSSKDMRRLVGELGPRTQLRRLLVAAGHSRPQIAALARAADALAKRRITTR